MFTFLAAPLMRSLLGAVLALFMAAPHAGASERKQDHSQMALSVTRHILEPTLAGLRDQAAADPALVALLSRVRVSTLSSLHPHVGRNAVATTREGHPAVIVDLVYLAETINVGALAGLAIVQNERTDALIASAMKDYQMAAAASPGGTAPDFEIDISGLGRGTALHAVATRMGVEVGLTTAAWLVLHEVGHHVLNHLAVEVSPGPESRELERRADEWAYRRLYELGFHLDFLDWFFMARAALEEVELTHGLATPEAASSHPLFATRRADLTRLYKVALATPVRMLAFVGIGWNETGEPQMLEAILSRRPDEDIQLSAMIWTSDASSQQVFDWRDGQVHIYGRSGDRATEVIVHHPDRVRTKVTMAFRDLRTGESLTRESIWIQTSLALHRQLTTGSVKASLVMDDPLPAILREALRDAGVDAATSVAVIDEYRAFFAGLRSSLVRYARGESTMAAYVATMEQASEQFSDRLRARLGTRWTEALEAAFLANPKLTAMTNAMMQR